MIRAVGEAHSDVRTFDSWRLPQADPKTYYSPSALVCDPGTNRIYIKDDISIQWLSFDMSVGGMITGKKAKILEGVPYGLTMLHGSQLVTVDSPRSKRDGILQFFDVNGGNHIKTAKIDLGSFDKNCKPRFIESLDKNLLMSDAGTNKVAEVDASGRFIQYIGKGYGRARTGQGAWGSFNLPAGISKSKNGEIYIADSRNRRIQIFGAERKHPFKASISGYPDNFSMISDIDICSSGNILLSVFSDRVVKLLQI